MRKETKYYISLDFFQGQSKKYGKYDILRGLLGEEEKLQSLREIGKRCGIISPQQVKHHLGMMIREGVLYREGDRYLFTPRFKKSIKIV